MAGGTQVTTTTAEPWAKQQEFLERGFGLAENLRAGGQFAPYAYGAPGTATPEAAALATAAPGLAGFSKAQKDAMGGIYDYALGERPQMMQ